MQKERAGVARFHENKTPTFLDKETDDAVRVAIVLAVSTSLGLQDKVTTVYCQFIVSEGKVQAR